MTFLRRILGGPPPPAWASFMRGDEYRAFCAAIERRFGARRAEVRIAEDGLYVEVVGEAPVVYGLSNLAQLCHQLPRADWPGAIETHFRNLEEAATADVALADREVALPLLKARVYRRTDLSTEALGGLVTMPLTPDLVAVLVYDLPTIVRTVSLETARAWPDPIDALFAVALEHLAAEVAGYERADLALETGGSVTGLSGPSFFVASQVLRLGEELGDVPNGALIAMPNRHGLFWHPIVAAGSTLAAIKALLPIAHRLHEDGPGSLTPELHWWHRGALTPLPSRIDGGRISFAPPEAFNRLLVSLADPD